MAKAKIRLLIPQKDSYSSFMNLFMNFFMNVEQIKL